jgi:Phage integrase family
VNIDSGFIKGRGKMEKFSPKVEDWLSTVCESSKTEVSYRASWAIFENFCLKEGKNPSKLVDDFRTIRYQGERERDLFLEDWQDTIRSFQVYSKKRYASLTDRQFRAIIKSFLRYWKIPLDVDLPKHPFVTYHNRDIKKEEIKLILNNATPRDRVLYLLLVESGLRTETAINLKYWQIKEDFESKKIPMRILLPSSTLKDHVGDRWSFIGEDGFKELSEYLRLRPDLKDDDYVFASEKKGLVKGSQFSPASLSVKFNRIVQKLKIDASNGKKPKKIRLHGLRKFFRNNHGADQSFKEFWMGHSLGVDAHYISRDPEEHRKRYSEGYNKLRVLEPNAESLADLYRQLQEKDREIKELKPRLLELEKQLKESDALMVSKMNSVLEKIMEKLKQELTENWGALPANLMMQEMITQVSRARKDPKLQTELEKEYERIKKGGN